MTSDFEIDGPELIPGLGARVSLNLADEISQQARTTLRELLKQHHLLVFSGTDITLDQQMEIARVFGRIVPTQAEPTLDLLISNVREEGYLGSAELIWHTDHAYLREPLRVGLLYALDVQAGRSSTRFISAVRAVERLPCELRQRLEYLQVLNTAEPGPQENGGAIPLGQRVATLGSDLVAAAHPVISVHPNTGDRYLTPTPYHSDCILGMSGPESRAILDEIFGHFYVESEVYEHYWSNGDLVIWDNLAVHHSRGALENAGPRTLRRVSVGIGGFEEQIPARLCGAWTSRSRAARERAMTASGAKS